MKKRLMIVDDSRVLEIQLEKLLEDTDFQIAAYCKNGEEAIALYDMIAPDLVTMDILMPGLDGLETARAILEEHPDARIVMVSSLGYDDTMAEANEIGAKGFICKPFKRGALLTALENALA